MRTCPCGNEITTTRGRPRCDDCRVPHRHYPMGPNARYTKVIVVRMPHSLHARIKECAAESGQTMADYIRDALRAHVMQ